MSAKLVEAAERGDLGLVRQLIAAGADMDHPHENSGFRPLIAAAANGQLDVADYLLANGVGVDLPVTHSWPTAFRGETALMLAAWHGQAKVVDLLIKRGANINHGCPNYRTAIYNAARRGNAAIVLQLIKAGAKPRATDLLTSVTHSQPESTKALLHLFKPIEHFSKDEPFAVAAIPMNRESIPRAIKVLRMVVEAGADINARADNGWTALTKAAAYDIHEMIPAILECGGKINLRAFYRKTALHIAAEHGRTNAVRVLIAAGAQLELKDDKRKTPFAIAKASRRNDVLTLIKLALPQHTNT